MRKQMNQKLRVPTTFTSDPTKAMNSNKNDNANDVSYKSMGLKRSAAETAAATTMPMTKTTSSEVRDKNRTRTDASAEISTNTNGIGIEEYNAKDVLSGRGGATNLHSGNQYYRQLILSYCAAYEQAKKITKPTISRQIVKLIREKGGRFLRKSKQDGLYYELDTSTANEKTSQALRHRSFELRNAINPHRIKVKTNRWTSTNTATNDVKLKKAPKGTIPVADSILPRLEESRTMPPCDFDFARNTRFGLNNNNLRDNVIVQQNSPMMQHTMQNPSFRHYPNDNNNNNNNNNNALPAQTHRFIESALQEQRIRELYLLRQSTNRRLPGNQIGGLENQFRQSIPPTLSYTELMRFYQSRTNNNDTIGLHGNSHNSNVISRNHTNTMNPAEARNDYRQSPQHEHPVINTDLLGRLFPFLTERNNNPS